MVVYDFLERNGTIFLRENTMGGKMRLLPIRKISRQSKRLALFLTFCAGYVDAYTFIVRGNTLVAGQTGNVVFLSVELIKNNVSDVRDKVLTLLAFMMGVFLLTIYKEKLRIVKKPILSLIPLAILSIIIAFVPQTVDNIYPNYSPLI